MDLPDEHHGSDRWDWAAATNSEATTQPGGLVGRSRELRELTRGLESALSGRGCLFLLSGDPGIGKSRLADELAAIAGESGAWVLWGRCWEAGGAPAYWPWVQAIRAYVRTVDPETLMGQMGAGAPFIAQMMPEIRDAVPSIPDPPSLEPEAARFRLFDATGTFLVNASRERPLALMFDDLHAADEPSLLLLQFVARELTGTHILIVGAYREVGVSRRQPFISALAELGRASATRRLNLSGLAHEETGPFIEATTGISPPEPLVAAIHDRTEGNPLFIAEVARLLASEGRLQQPEIGRLTIPEGVREVIRRRLERLSSGCIELLTVGSVLGREFGIEALGHVGGGSGEDLLELLEEATRARVLVEVPGPPRRFRFSHVLVRDALYDDLPPGRRVELHREIGEVLESIHSKDLESHLAEVAHHFIEAAPGGDIGKAIDYAKRAGDRAITLLAYEEAGRLYRMALRAQELAESPEEEDRCDLLVRLGDAQARAGDAGGASETFLRAARLAKRLDLPDHLGWAALGYGGRFVWTRGSMDPQLVPLLQDALTALPTDDSALRARLMARLASALRDDLDREPRRKIAGEAVAMARRLRDQATLAYALGGQFPAIYGPENARDRLAIADELIEVAEAIGENERATDGHIYRLWPLFELGEMPRVLEELEAAARVAHELRQPPQAWLVAVTRSMLALFEGRLEAAEEMILEARRTGEPAEWQADASYLTQMFALKKEQGRLEEWRGPIERGAAQYRTRPMFRCLLADLYAELGEKEAAARTFESLAADDFTSIPPETEWLLSMSLLVEVADFLGDAARCQTLYELLRPYADLNVMDANEFSTGSVSRYLAIAASVMARWDDAATHYEYALEANERMGARPWLARTQHDYARMLLARDAPGDGERAIELLTKAREICTDVGMALGGAVSALLLNLGVEAEAAPDAAPKEGPSRKSVYRREGEYYSVVFQGDSFRLKDTKGLRYLAHLLANPGREVHVLDLVLVLEAAPAPREASKVGSTEVGLDARGLGDAGAALDPQARAAYKRRLEELRQDVEEAESFGDQERAARAQEEMDFLAQELAAAVGLGGRDRKAASAAERARQSVTKAIKNAVDRIAEHSPALGRYLRSTVRTGTFCAYRPDPGDPISWDLSR